MSEYVFGCRGYLDTNPDVPSASDIGLYSTYLGDGNALYAYVASRNSDCLEIVDISDPTTPTHEARINDGDEGGVVNLNFPEDVFVYDNCAYVAAQHSDALEIINVSDTLNLKHEGSIGITDPRHVFVKGNYAYVTFGGTPNGLCVVDVSNPATPSIVGTINNGDGDAVLDNPRGVYVKDNHAYVVSRDGVGTLEIIDISTPTNPVHAGKIDNNSEGGVPGLSTPNNVFVKEHTDGKIYAYVSSTGSNCLEIVNVTDPTTPVHAARINTGGDVKLNSPMWVFVKEHTNGKIYVYVVSIVSDALEIVDVSDPETPVHEGSISNGAGGAALDSPQGVFVEGDHAYVASWTSDALEVVDISDPTTPTHAGIISDGDGGAGLNGAVRVFVRTGFERGVFRWIEKDISALNPTIDWKANILKPSPFNSIEESVDLTYGGNLPSIGGNTIRVINTIKYGKTYTQLDKILEDNNIRLNGLRWEIVRFEISGGALVDPSGEIIYRGIAGDVSWDEKQYVIPLESSLFKRRANLATIINTKNSPEASGDIIGQTYPVTLGQFTPLFNESGGVLWNGYAKFKRIANSEAIYKTLAIQVLNTSPTQIALNVNVEDGEQVFPIVGDDGDDPPIMYQVQFAAREQNIVWYEDGSPISSGTYSLSWFVDQYIKVVNGDGNGTYRKIASAQVDLDNSAAIFEFTMADYFKDTLQGNATAKADDQSWVEIIDINREYAVDVWPCENYLDQDGNVITKDINFYSFSEDSRVKVSGNEETVPVESLPVEFYRLPQYAYEDTGVGDKNMVEIDVKLFDNNPDQMNSFVGIPVVDPKKYDEDDLSQWLLNGDTANWDSFIKMMDGLYYRPPYAPSIGDITLTEPEGPITDTIDKDASTLYELNLGYPHTSETRLALVVSFNMPDLPNKYNFDDVFLGVKGESFGWDVASYLDAQLQIRYRRFMGYPEEIFTKTNGDNYFDKGVTATFKDDPDFYYSSNPGTKNQYFYVDNDVSGSDEQDFWGYVKYQFNDVDTPEKYNAVKECIIILYHRYATATFNYVTWLKLYELMILLRKSVSIKDAIYSPLRARIYDSTWGARKTSTDMINDPIGMLEHSRRLQNWSEVGETKDWGKEYATSPLIDTTTSEGGFDYEDLDGVKSLRPSRQILTKNQAWTDDIARSLCKQFFLCAFQNPTNGEERVAYIADKSLTSPSTTITLSDIIGPITLVRMPRMKNIFCEPVIRYAKNNANGEYEKVIQITNSNAETYSSDYVVGLSGSTAELMWTRANALWKATRKIEPPPADMTNLDWVVTDSDAEWYLDTWLTWMGAFSTDGTTSGVIYEPKKRYGWTVPYDIGKDWFITQHHLLSLPHQTDSVAIEFMIEKISKNIKKGKESVSVEVVLYGSAVSIDTFVQDTWVNGTLLNDVQDTWETQTENPANAADWQDVS